MSTSSRWERVNTRIVAGLSLLMMLSLPLSIVPWIWSGDWRWPISGVVLGLTGLGIGWVLRETAKEPCR